MSSSESPSPQRAKIPGFKIQDHIEMEETVPMIKPSYADQFGSQLNQLTDGEKIIEDEFLIKHKRLLVMCKITFLFGLMYLFVCSLELMSIGFRLIGGKKASRFLNSDLISNPVVGVMIGVLVTVLVQSSSTSTSIVVTMVSSDMIKVRNAIPIVMGANVGTSITNTIVSFVQPGNSDQFARAFAAATVHDCFNILSVIVLLPIECITHYLEFITDRVMLLIDFQKQVNHKTQSKPFIKQITSPFIMSIIRVDNRLLEKIRLNSTTDGPSNNDESSSLVIKCCDKVPNGENTTTLKRHSYCTQSCYSIFNYIGLRDSISGLLLLALAIFLLCVCLISVVKILNSMLKGKIANIIKTYINAEYKKPWSYLIGYLALFIGCIMTILVQSSSIFTSTLTPLAGLGVISIERIYPLTLGSNIGTTTTGIFAALTADQSRIKESLQLAFCHLFFNITGILIFYIFPVTRIPIPLARHLGRISGRYRWFSVVYLVLFFFLLPMIIFFLSLAGHLIFILIITPLIFLLMAIVQINYCQSRFPLLLPVYLRT